MRLGVHEVACCLTSACRRSWIASTAALTGVVVAGTLASGAHAATVSIDRAGTLHYLAAAGELNTVTMSALEADVLPSPSDRLQITDTSATLIAGRGCTSAPAALICLIPANIDARLGDGDDRADLRLWPALSVSDISASMFGGPGNDTLLYDASEGDVEMAGGPGDDTLSMANEGNGRATGDAGDDSISGANPTFDDTKWYLGGPGDDFLRAGGDGNDMLDGGTGADRMRGPEFELANRAVLMYAARGQPVSVTFDNVANDGENGERDNVEVGNITELRTGAGDDFVEWPSWGLAALDMGRGVDTVSFALLQAPWGEFFAPATVENLIGSPFDDVLYGNAIDNHITGADGHDRLYGFAGRDMLDGGGGADEVDAGTDADILRLQDGVTDTAICGAGKDVVAADPLDSLAPDCEPPALPKNKPT